MLRQICNWWDEFAKTNLLWRIAKTNSQRICLIVWWPRQILHPGPARGANTSYFGEFILSFPVLVYSQSQISTLISAIWLSAEFSPGLFLVYYLQFCFYQIIMLQCMRAQVRVGPPLESLMRSADHASFNDLMFRLCLPVRLFHQATVALFSLLQMLKAWLGPVENLPHFGNLAQIWKVCVWWIWAKDFNPHHTHTEIWWEGVKDKGFLYVYYRPQTKFNAR